MSEIGDAIQEKCMAIGDRVINLNDYLLSRAANAKPAFKMVGGKRVYEKTVPVYLQSIANLSNQLLRAGTSIGANNAEATNAISKADFKSRRLERHCIGLICYTGTNTLTISSMHLFMHTVKNL